MEGNLKNDKGEPLELANVILYQNGEIIKVKTSDFDGYYFMDNIDEGKYELIISFSGVKSPAQIINIKDRELFVSNTEMSTAKDIPPTIVFVDKTLFDRNNPTMDVIPKDAFVESGKKQVNKLIALTSSVTIDKEGNTSFRGSRPGQGAFYVDGMRLDGNLDIPTASIYSMKIHNGGIPAAYGNTTSAVVVIETKSYFNMFD